MREGFLRFAICQYIKGFWIEVVEEAAFLSVRIGYGEEIVIQAYLCIEVIICVNPVNCTAYFSAVGRIAGFLAVHDVRGVAPEL